MNKQQEAHKLALEAMQECRRDPRLKYEHPYYDKTIAAIREALAEQPEQPFNPDWSLLKATQESLREHMATLHKLKAALKLALEALEVLGWQPTEEAMDYRDNAIDAIRSALAEQPEQQESEAIHAAWMAGYTEGEREAIEKQTAQQQAYEQANPLGGPAKVFQAMANAIRAGDDYHAVLRQYGYAEAQQQELVAWRDHVEQRLLTWRQSFVNKSGDQLALDDFMDKQSLDDLIDFVCDEYTSPPASKPWVSLTDEEMKACTQSPFVVENYRAIEAKLKEKNA